MNEERYLRLLALALNKNTPDHRIRYLLKKLYGLDSLSLYPINSEILERINKIKSDLLK